MINTVGAFSGAFSPYVLMNLIVALLCSAAFLHIYVYSRHLYLRPSMMLGGLMNLYFQWPLAAYAFYYQTWLPHPFDMSLIVHAPLLTTLIIGAAYNDQSLRTAWDRLDVPHTVSAGVVNLILAAMTLLAAVIAAVYFSYVPFRCTGLYAAFFDLTNTSVFREISLKNLTNSVPRYSLSFLSGAVIPVLCMICAVQAQEMYLSGQRRQCIFLCAFFVIALPFVFISGAKGYVVNLLLLVALAFIWQKKLPCNFRSLLFTILLPLVPACLLMIATGFAVPGSAAKSVAHLKACTKAVAISYDYSTTPVMEGISLEAAIDHHAAIQAERRRTSAQSNTQSFPENAIVNALDVPKSVVVIDNIQAVLFRAFIDPQMVAGWHIHYAQTHGTLGIHGIKRMANFFHVDFVDAFNQVSLIYGPIYYGHAVPPTSTANAGFIFKSYVNFGLAGILISIASILLLDIFACGYRFLSGILLAPYAAVLSIGMLKLLQTGVAVVMVSHGLLISAALLFMAEIAIRAASARKNTKDL